MNSSNQQTTQDVNDTHCTGETLDTQRRALLKATGGVGMLGAGAFVTPMVSSFSPSERAKASGAPVEVDISDLKVGEQKIVEWRGKPVWVLRRTEEMTANLHAHDADLVDPNSLKPYSMPVPEYCKNQFLCRVEHKDIMVMVAVCTHLGCSPESKFKTGGSGSLSENWPGGYLCPCHGSTFDLAGRVFKNKPAPQNLDIPPYMFVTDSKLIIGKDENGEA